MAHRHEPTDPSALLDVIAHTVPVVGFDWDLLDNTIGWSATTSTLEAWKLGPQDTGHTLLEHVHPDDLLRVRWTLSDGAVLHLLACFGEHRHAVDAPPGETLHSVGALGEAVDAASAPDEHPQRLRLARGAVHLSLQVSDVE